MGSQRNCTWILGLAGFRVVTTESDGEAVDSRVTIRIERRGSRGYGCSGCGRRTRRVRSARDRTWDDLPWASHPVTLIDAQRRVRCRQCGIRTEAIAFADAKARVTRRLRQQIGVDCQSMPTSHAAVRHGVSWGKARRAEHAFLREWDAHRPRRRPRHLGADEMHRGKAQKFYTVLSDLVHGEVLGLAKDRTETSLAGLLTTCLDARQRAAVEAVCTDMHRPYVNAVAHQLPTAEIVCDKFHVLQHASAALDDVRRQEFFRAGAVMRAFGRGKRWLLLRRWKTVRGSKRGRTSAALCGQPAVVSSIRLARATRSPLDLQDPRWRGAVPLRLAQGATLATVARDGTARRHPGQPLRRHRRLLRPSGPVRRRRVPEHYYQGRPSPRARHAR